MLQNALTDKTNDRQVFMKGIDTSYQYEGYNTYSMDAQKHAIAFHEKFGFKQTSDDFL